MSATLKEEIWGQSKEWINAIGEVVNEMASKLGVASEHIYTVYTKQMFYEGVMEIISSLLFVALLFIVLRLGLRKLKSMSDLEKEEDDKGVYMFISFVAIALFVVITAFQLDDIKNGSMMVFNPEYYTMKDLVDTVKSLISEETP